MKKSIAMFLLGVTIAFGVAYAASVIANACWGTYDKTTIMKEMRALATLEFEIK